MSKSQAYLFRRYLWLFETVMAYGPISFEEISRRWEASALNDEGNSLPHKTFENHRRAIEEIMGADIYCDRRTNLYSVDPEQLPTSRPDAGKLLEQMLITRSLNEVPTLRDAVEFEQAPGGAQFLSPILECLRENRKARIEYIHGYLTEKHTLCEVVPVGLKLFKRRWYLIGSMPDGSTTYSFALDRIKSLTPTEQHSFARPALRELYSDCFGIIREPGGELEHIVLKVTAAQALYLAALPLHPTQREIRRDDSHVWFALDLIPAYDFMMELLANGKDLEVVAPESLRIKIAAEIAAMQNLYKQ